MLFLPVVSVQSKKDLYLAIYPSVVLLRLNMCARKIALCFVLGLGSV